MSLKCYIGLLSTEVNCILCEQWDFQFSLRLFVSAAVRIRMGSLKLLKTFDAHPSEARALQLSDLTTAQSGKRQLFDVDGHRTHLVWIFKVFQSHIVDYRRSSVSSNMHWLTAETSEHSQIFIFGKLKSGSSCLLDRWGKWGLRWTGDFPGLGRAAPTRLRHKAGKLFNSGFHSIQCVGNISNKEILTTIFPSPQEKSPWYNLLRWCRPLSHWWTGLFSFGHGFGSDFWKRWNCAHEGHYHPQTWQGFRGSGDKVPSLQWQLSSLNISPKHLQRLPLPQ